MVESRVARSSEMVRSSSHAWALDLAPNGKFLAVGTLGGEILLLDTQGTIFLKAGDYAQAISSLEEATAGGATDARYYFHLAAAYQLANRIEEAISALQSSRDLRLGNTMLTNDDRLLLAHLDQELRQHATAAVGDK